MGRGIQPVVAPCVAMHTGVGCWGSRPTGRRGGRRSGDRDVDWCAGRWVAPYPRCWWSGVSKMVVMSVEWD